MEQTKKMEIKTRNIIVENKTKSPRKKSANKIKREEARRQAWIERRSVRVPTPNFQPPAAGKSATALPFPDMAKIAEKILKPRTKRRKNSANQIKREEARRQAWIERRSVRVPTPDVQPLAAGKSATALSFSDMTEVAEKVLEPRTKSTSFTPILSKGDGGDQRDAGRPSIMNTLATDTSIINNENNSAKKMIIISEQ